MAWDGQLRLNCFCLFLRITTSNTILRIVYSQSIVGTNVGTLRSDDDDGNENVKKTIGLKTKTTMLRLHHAFSYISLHSLHDCDVNMPNFKFYRGST